MESLAPGEEIYHGTFPKVKRKKPNNFHAKKLVVEPSKYKCNGKLIFLNFDEEKKTLENMCLVLLSDLKYSLAPGEDLYFGPLCTRERCEECCKDKKERKTHPEHQDISLTSKKTECGEVNVFNNIAPVETPGNKRKRALDENKTEKNRNINHSSDRNNEENSEKQIPKSRFPLRTKKQKDSNINKLINEICENNSNNRLRQRNANVNYRPPNLHTKLRSDEIKTKKVVKKNSVRKAPKPSLSSTLLNENQALNNEAITSNSFKTFFPQEQTVSESFKALPSRRTRRLYSPSIMLDTLRNFQDSQCR